MLFGSPEQHGDNVKEVIAIDPMIDWPEIGTREAAVRSCVSVLSAVCGQPETVMERWLDLYYQVRHAQEKADAAARAAERLKEMTQLEAAVLVPSQSAAPTAPPEGEPRTEGAPAKESRPGGKGTPRPSQIGNTRVHDAAVFKRQVRDRLEAARKNGVSAPEIIKAAPGGEVTPDRIYSILEGRVLKIEVYRALDKALRHFEN